MANSSRTAIDVAPTGRSRDGEAIMIEATFGPPQSSFSINLFYQLRFSPGNDAAQTVVEARSRANLYGSPEAPDYLWDIVHACAFGGTALHDA